MKSVFNVCHECPPDAETCWHTVSTVAPNECQPCRYCGTKHETYSEFPANGDWAEFDDDFPGGRGFVMRIGCLCDAAIHNELWTEFEPWEKAIAQWNEMQTDPELIDKRPA